MEQLNNLWFNLWFLKQGTPSNVCQKPLYSKICEKKGKCWSVQKTIIFIFLFFELVYVYSLKQYINLPQVKKHELI